MLDELGFLGLRNGGSMMMISNEYIVIDSILSLVACAP